MSKPSKYLVHPLTSYLLEGGQVEPKTYIGHDTQPYPEWYAKVDIPCPIGQKVHAMTAGIVNRVSDYYVQIRSTDQGYTYYYNPNHVLYFTYMHLNEIWVKQGDRISKGEVIGLSGDNRSPGSPHLHMTISEIPYSDNENPPSDYLTDNPNYEGFPHIDIKASDGGACRPIYRYDKCTTNFDLFEGKTIPLFDGGSRVMTYKKYGTYYGYYPYLCFANPVKIDSTKPELHALSEEDARWLLTMASLEAKVLGDIGMEEVIACTYNRLNSSSFPNTIPDIIRAPNQFSTYSENKDIFEKDGGYSLEEIQRDTPIPLEFAEKLFAGEISVSSPEGWAEGYDSRIAQTYYFDSLN